MELDYFLLFTTIVLLVMVLAVFGRRSPDSMPYGDQYYSDGTPMPQQHYAPPPQPIVIITKNEPASTLSGGGGGFLALLILSLVIYFYVTDTEENPSTLPAPVQPQEQKIPASEPNEVPDSNGIVGIGKEYLLRYLLR